jgi:DNA-binding MarR family transcriptional regulator
MSDQNTYVPPDHIGWTLWQAAQVWRGEFTTAMVAAGHDWFGQARGNLMMHICPEGGIRQGDLAGRVRMSKQAVQQFVDELVDDGILARTRENGDARSWRLRLTPAGEAAMRDADRIKLEIEMRWRARIGPEAFDALNTALKSLSSQPAP